MSIFSLTSQKDTFVFSQKPLLTPCESPFLLVGTWRIGKFISYVFFDLSPIPKNVQIKSAILSLFPAKPPFKGDPPDSVTIRLLADNFEDCVTNFINRPASLEKPKVRTEINPYTQVINIDIKDIVLSWLTGKLANKGLSIASGCLFDRKILAFHSSNSPNPNLRPILTIKTDRPIDCCVENIEEELEVFPVDTFSTTREVWCFSIFSFIVKNMGTLEVLLTLQDSADGIDFIDESPEFRLLPQQSGVFVNRFFTRFTRLKLRLAPEQDGIGKVNIFLQGRIN